MTLSNSNNYLPGIFQDRKPGLNIAGFLFLQCAGKCVQMNLGSLLAFLGHSLHLKKNNGLVRETI